MFKRSHPSDRLRNVSLFAECSEAELAQIDSSLTRVQVDAGQVLLREGRLGSQLLIVVDGELGVTRTTPTGHTEVAIVGPGGFVGEIALLERRPRTATVTALTAATVYACNPREFATLMAVPSVAAKLRSVAAERVEANRATFGTAA
jgi:CRP-like cAMP-binding protein